MCFWANFCPQLHAQTPIDFTLNFIHWWGTMLWWKAQFTSKCLKPVSWDYLFEITCKYICIWLLWPVISCFSQNVAYYFPIELLVMPNVGQPYEAEVPAVPVRRDWIPALICYLHFPIGKEALSWCDSGKASSLLAVLPFFPAPGQNPSFWVHLPCPSGSPLGQEMPASLQPWSIWSADAEQLLVSSWLSLHKEKSSI